MKDDKPRFLEIIARERDRLLNFVRKRLRWISSMDIEDIVSDVILNLFRREDTLDNIENLTAYLYRSLSNRMVDFNRKRMDTFPLDTEISQDSTASQLPATINTPEQELEQREMRERITDALGRLKPHERALWIATEIDGRSYNELAEEWDEPIGTLLSRKSRTNAKLRDLLTSHHLTTR